MTATAIELKDVFRVHSTPEGDAAALQGLSLRVRDGEVLTVLGPSGSGKSTLLRLLAGLDRPSAGQVRVYGDDLAKLTPRRLARYRSSRLGYADQHYSRALSPELTARELVSLQLGLHGATRAERMRRADELLERVGLSEKRGRRPSELSGGEQQRVALCAALAHRPKVFLADEPTGELDAATAEQVYDVMSDLLREHHCTTVIVSHDPESARIADRIVRIRDGRVSEEWARDGGEADTIVVGRGGWLRLPEELLLRAGIGSHATARFKGGSLVLEPARGSEAPAKVSDTLKVSDTPADTRVVAEVGGLRKRFGETVVPGGGGERATRRVGRLSQGERARVAIARAIASKPALLLADEPTSRLDGANAISVAVLLARLARETGTAALCSTHDPLVIEQADARLTLG